MILPDVNLLIYANNPVAREHTPARNWLEAILTGNEPVGFCWPVLCGFLRVSTNARVFPDPLEMDEALDLVEDWIGREHVVVIAPTDRHWVVLVDLLVKAKIRGSMTTDAEIAAYAVEHGATLYTADRGFARFPSIKIVNPLGS
jgi:toxin-antitoxin system PIN domain toxin